MGNNENRNDNGRLTRKHYGKELSRLQLELCKLQDWVKYKGLRVIVVFEGRDAAGKGGTIRAITNGSVRACSVSLLYRLRQIVRRARCIFSAICSISQRRERS